MKRIFSAIAVLAIVSGALAFKAHTFQPASVYCYPAGTVTGVCSLNQTTFDVTPTGIGDPCAPAAVAHITSGGNCVDVPAGSKFTDRL